MCIQLAVGFSLASCDWGIFAEISWTPGEMEQAEDRLFDVNKRSSIMIQHIVVNGSIDANMAKLIVEKQDIINKTLDN